MCVLGGIQIYPKLCTHTHTTHNTQHTTHNTLHLLPPTTTPTPTFFPQNTIHTHITHTLAPPKKQQQQALLPLMAPILPHMAEDAWQALPYTKPTTSVFQAGWPTPDPAWTSIAAQTNTPWPLLLQLRTEVNGVLEKARVDKALGASLEAKVMLHVGDEGVQEQLLVLENTGNSADPLRYLLIVSQVRWYCMLCILLYYIVLYIMYCIVSEGMLLLLVRGCCGGWVCC